MRRPAIRGARGSGLGSAGALPGARRRRRSPPPLRGAGYLSFTPFSVKYFTAPGWNGIGLASAFWFSSLKFAASL